tara:strand:- start:348 stop:941 length:594 start_codon:yes stop_codon:yes gene_type:complete
MTYCFDIDGTICETTDGGTYESTKPYPSAISAINKLYDDGHTIFLYTARGSVSGKDWSELTKNQIDSWGLKYHELKMGKPFYDLMVDDRAINANLWRSNLNKKTALIHGSFDFINSDLCKKLNSLRATEKYNNIVAAIQSDPKLDDESLDSPINSLSDRIEVLRSISYINEIIPYRVKSDIKMISEQIRAQSVHDVK